MGTFDDAAMSAYLKSRDDARADQADAMLACLTERERALVREAAVLGYAMGSSHGRYEDRSTYPKDSQVLENVLIDASNMSDLYPNLSRLWIDEDEHSEHITQITLTKKPSEPMRFEKQGRAPAVPTGVQRRKKAKWRSSRRRRS